MPGAGSTTIPAPIGGWNAREPLDGMPETDAIRLINVFPETSEVRLRRGYDLHVDSSSRFDSLFDYNHANGTRKLIGCSAGGTIEDVTTAGAPTVLKSGVSTGKWQGVLFRNTLILVSGADQPLQYDGSSIADATYTGPSDDANLISVDVYKTQLFFVEKQSASIWYGGTNNITGALTEYDVSGILRKGGNILFAGSWTKDIGSGLNDMFVIVSNVGEVLVFTGDNPGASNWSIAGRFYISSPLSRRSFCQFGSDLLILNREGITPLSEIMRDTNQPARLTDKIQDAFSGAIRSYGSNFGWEMVWYPKNHSLIVNIPISENLEADQYVMNTLTGAWCQFTGMNAGCWCVSSDTLYFGSQRDSRVYEADTGYADYDQPISVDIKSAFSYFDDRQRIKHFQNLRPLITSESALNFNLEVDVDFEDRLITATASTTGASTGSSWNTSAWNTATWGGGVVTSNDWYALDRFGRCAAYRMAGDFENVSWSMTALNITFEQGGIF